MTGAGSILIAGGSGFVGQRLVGALVADGRDVRVMTRRPEAYAGPGRPVFGDVEDPDSVAKALVGASAAYYLVHALNHDDFEVRDAKAASDFGQAAADAGVEQIVYLGGLGDDRDDLSAHLRSRREVESLLGSAGVPVTVIRAGIVIGHGGISWELTRQLVDHLPGMITPRWVRTRTQPIAVGDVVRYLTGMLGNPQAIGRTFDVGGPEVLAYSEMLKRVAALEGRELPVVPVPLLSPRLSARWLAFVTDVDPQAGRHLIDSMVNEVVVRDDSIRTVVPFEPLGYDDAVRIAMAERSAAIQAGEMPARRGLPARLDALIPKPISHIAVPREPESQAVRRRRQRVVAVTSLAGAALLGRSLNTKPGSPEFFLATGTVAATWAAGGLLSGPLHLGWIENRDSRLRRPVLTPLVTGLGAFGVFYAGAHVAKRIPFLDRALAEVLAFADEGDSRLVLATTLANGLSEELFFRGALYAGLENHAPVVSSTAVYTVATVTTRNPALVVAAAVMGGLFGLQRRASGGLQAPILTHLTWSSLMLRFMPPLFRRPESPQARAIAEAAGAESLSSGKRRRHSQAGRRRVRRGR